MEPRKQANLYSLRCSIIFTY